MARDLDDAFDARHESASRRLAMAIRLELNHAVATAIEERLRAIPDALTALAADRRAALRQRVDADAAAAAEALAQPIADLRVYYGATDRSPDEEARGFARTVAEAAAAVIARLVAEFALGESAAVPAVGPATCWAWRQVRELDAVRNRLADGVDGGFEATWHLA